MPLSLIRFKFQVRQYSTKNKTNVKTFFKNVISITKGENVEKLISEKKVQDDDEFWNKSEWTVGGILVRVYVYGLALLFLFLGLFGLYYTSNDIHFITMAFGFFFIAYILYQYIIKYDIEIILEKNRRKRSKNKNQSN